MRPAGFRAVPYFHQDANPFDREGKIYWTGDEETADDRRWPRQYCTGNSGPRASRALFRLWVFSESKARRSGKDRQAHLVLRPRGARTGLEIAPTAGRLARNKPSSKISRT
jgi:hypothetical protein